MEMKITQALGQSLATNPMSFQWVAQQLPKGPNPNWSLIPAL